MKIKKAYNVEVGDVMTGTATWNGNVTPFSSPRQVTEINVLTPLTIVVSLTSRTGRLINDMALGRDQWIEVQ